MKHTRMHARVQGDPALCAQYFASRTVPAHCGRDYFVLAREHTHTQATRALHTRTCAPVYRAASLGWGCALCVTGVRR
eukprot:gene16897-biopygen8287